MLFNRKRMGWFEDDGSGGARLGAKFTDDMSQRMSEAGIVQRERDRFPEDESTGPAWRRLPELGMPDNLDWFTLSDSVGDDKPNDRQDVIKIESVLANAGDHDMARTDGPTGYFGGSLRDGIVAFQKRNGLEPDGVIDPDGPTISTLRRDMGEIYKEHTPPTPDQVEDHHQRLARGEKGSIVFGPPPVDLHPIDDLPEIDAEDFGANTRTVQVLRRYGQDGEVPKFTALDIVDRGAPAIAKARDIVAQMRDFDERRANGLASGILSYLPTDEHRRAFLGGAPPKPLPFGVKSIAPDNLAGTAGDDTLGQAPTQEEKKPQESEPTAGDESQKTQETGTPTNDESQKPQETEQQTAETPTTPPAPTVPQPPADGTPKGDTGNGEMQNQKTSDIPPSPPDYRKDNVSQKDWDAFKGSLDKVPGLSDAQKSALMHVFAAEGGGRSDPNSTAKGGILDETLERAKSSGKFPDLAAVEKAKDLTPDQMAQVYKHYLDDTLRTVGGSDALNDLDPKTGAVLADTMFRHGRGDGARLRVRKETSIMY
ncbi:MAG: peptidoglycan-binding protein [Alphaproteobacteria bacterium]